MLVIAAIWVICLVILWFIVDRSLKIGNTDADGIRRPETRSESE